MRAMQIKPGSRIEVRGMIPVSEPLVGQREVEYVTECLRSGWISSSGRFIQEFEEKWAAYCGMQHAVAMSNGTTALQAAVACAALRPGDLVVMPTFTIISCALAIIYNGGLPLLVDCDPRTWCMDANQVEEKIEAEARKRPNRLKAIMPVHIYGHPVDMDPIRKIACRHGLLIIEDAAEAHGAEYLSNRFTRYPEWKKCGGLGDISIFSFYANKLITTGEGGMLLTSNPGIAEKARNLRNLCFGPERRFRHTELGHNFRMTNLQAAIGLAQLERMEAIVSQKRWIGHAYTERLQDVAGLQLPVQEPWAKQIYWMYGVILDESTGLDAESCAQKLKTLGIETRPFFLGMHEQPAFHKMGLFREESFPVAERIARQGLYLPSGLTLSDAQIDEVCEAVRKVLK
jgi:perosamine synthetase